ncbi:MAG TPA: hypothetical protein VID26_10040 [Candidatus Limnocylindrales bacterium]|jgi:hypothetical protein
MGDFISWINQNAQAISIYVAVVVAVVPALWAFALNLRLRNKALQHERFNIYHDLVRQLVQPDAPGGAMSIDRQIAVVFELRNFPEYYELTMRMLEGLRATWTNPNSARLTQEIGFTIDYIAANSKLKPKPTTDSGSATPPQ